MGRVSFVICNDHRLFMFESIHADTMTVKQDHLAILPRQFCSNYRSLPLTNGRADRRTACRPLYHVTDVAIIHHYPGAECSRAGLTPHSPEDILQGAIRPLMDLTKFIDAFLLGIYLTLAFFYH